jgi:2-haloacid dehalogenase
MRKRQVMGNIPEAMRSPRKCQSELGKYRVFWEESKETMSSGLDWKRFGLMTFDCYGTLVDWEAGILSVLKPWAATKQMAATGEELLAAFGEAESVAEQARPSTIYREILRETMKGMALKFGKTASAAEQEALAASVGDWPVFKDTAEGLRVLHVWHKLMVVSNVDKTSFARTAPKLGVTLDGLVTAEDVGAYKPDKRMFERAMQVARELGVKKEEILHVAQSLFHDVAPAKALGLSTVWVDRRGGRAGGATPKSPGDVRPHLRVGSLAELAEMERAERA